jgi:lactoylglutathione lyase
LVEEVELRIELFPSDLDRFADFYVRVLRFELVSDKRAEPSPYLSVRRDGVKIGATRAWVAVDPVARTVPQGVEVVLEVDDLVAERDAIVAAGWPVANDITLQPWGLTDFRLFDPDGHYIRFTTR